MASPSSNVEFLELVRKSNVLDDKVLDDHVQKLRVSGSFPDKPLDVARELVRAGLLTKFQAEHLLQGKWRRFIIGKYKILERLGSGGMGTVYRCEHKFMKRQVAVKILPPLAAENASSLERFYREARAVAALDHPNIVRAFDIDQDEDLHFLVMEYIDGSSLHDLVRRNGPLDFRLAANYIGQAALGLEHANQRAAVVHRDIKPENILVDRTGVVKILDLGLACFYQDDNDMLSKVFDEKVLGTADYLAPEQVQDGQAVDIRADIYSLGATFYYCLTGQTPFGPGSAALKRIWHQVRQPKPIGNFRKDVPDELTHVVTMMMAKNPAQRYATPFHVAHALAPWGILPAAANGKISS